MYEVPGCLASIEKSMINFFVSENEKKLLTVANQMLNNISMKDSLKLRTPVRISGHSLEKAVSKIQCTNSIDSMMNYIEQMQVIYCFFFSVLTTENA